MTPTNHPPTETPSDPARTAAAEKAAEQCAELVNKALQATFDNPANSESLDLTPPILWAIDTATAALRREIQATQEAAMQFEHDATSLGKELEEARGYIAQLPADWLKDSSLETWFPVTSEVLSALRREVEEVKVVRDGLGDALDRALAEVEELREKLRISNDPDYAVLVHQTLAAVTKERDEFEARERDQYSLTELAERARDAALARAEAGAKALALARKALESMVPAWKDDDWAFARKSSRNSIAGEFTMEDAISFHEAITAIDAATKGESHE